MPRKLSTGWRRALEQETRPPSRPLPRREGRLVPGLSLLWHADPRRVGERALLRPPSTGEAALLSRVDPVFAPPGRSGEAPLADPHLSRRPLRLRPLPGGGVELDTTDSPTPVSIGGERVEGVRRFPRRDLEAGVALLLADRVLLLLHLLQPVAPEPPQVPGLLGESPAMLTVRSEIALVRPLPVPVLLHGASGTGKELVARALHRGGPFVAVNLGAIPPNLAAAELFGATRGAYTGADRTRPGYFRRADGGTLFLDEIGETPPEVQPLLLRALESGEVQPVGGETTYRSTARIVAATDVDLDREVSRGRFRAPLYHRLATYTLRLPPLCERRDDLARLLVHFLTTELGQLDRRARLAPAGPESPLWLPGDLVARLVAAPWPGNVRQLRNAARWLALRAGDAAQVSWTPELEALLAVPTPRRSAGEPAKAAGSPKRRPEEVDDEEIRRALEDNAYRVQAAARALGISRGSLYRRIESSPDLRTGAELPGDELTAALDRAAGDAGEAARDLGVSLQALKRRLHALGLSSDPGSP